MSNKKCGIYKIRNIKNNKFYIGRSKDIRVRVHSHRWALESNEHPNQFLQNDWIEFGPEAFEFAIIVQCAENDYIAIEQVYLDTFKPPYNIAQDSLAPMAGRKHKPEVIEAQRIRNQGSGNPMYGKRHAEETRRKISVSRTAAAERATEETRQIWRQNALRIAGTFKAHTPESKARLRESAHKIEVVCSNGQTYTSQNDAAKALGLRQGHISEVINGTRSSAGGFKFWRKPNA